MNNMSKLLRGMTLIQISITLTLLAVAALGGVIDHVYLAYVWYLALAGIATIMLTSVTAGLILLAGRCIRWYRHQLQAWDGHAVGV